MKRCALLLLALLPACLDPLYEGPPDAGAAQADAGPPPQPDGGIVGGYLAPEVVLVVDRSGSMTDPASASGESCADPNGNYDPNRTLDCKWNNLLSVMEGRPGSAGMLEVLEVALSASGADARLGLITFSDREHGDSCSPGVVRVPVAAHSRQAIAQALDATQPAGATPTGTTLGVVPSAFPAASGATPERYAILLTDGLPNCNPGITASEQSCGGARCTTECDRYNWGGCACNPEFSPQASLLCLDDDGLVNAVAALNTAPNQIRTFVIGFGAGTMSSVASDTLDRAAQAGGTNAQSPALTQTRYYQANSAAELSDAMRALTGQIGASCRFSLAQAAPAGARSLQVSAGPLSAQVPATGFALDSERRLVSLHDANLCQALRGAAEPHFTFGS